PVGRRCAHRTRPPSASRPAPGRPAGTPVCAAPPWRAPWMPDPLPPRSLREDIADRAACGSECGLHSAVAALVMAPIAHILGSVSVKRIPGGALASTGVAKSPGACRGGSFPRKSSGKLIVANDDNYALAA